jgi:hypothetical protein
MPDVLMDDRSSLVGLSAAVASIEKKVGQKIAKST